MSENEITLTKIGTLSDWVRVYRLYRRAFPKYERKPFFMILRTRARGNADVWVIGKGGSFAGLAITMGRGELILLDYFAVSEAQRGAGIGGAALRLLRQAYRGKRLFLEIESTQTDAENLPERLRRKQFYLRNGLTEMHTLVELFGVEMELLGFDCVVDFAEYQELYIHQLGAWAEDKVKMGKFLPNG